MAQTRIYDFGALLTQARTKSFASRLFTPGLYEGFEPTILTPTLLEFAPGTFLMPNGVLINESGVIQVTVPTPATPEDYTITADHDDVQAVGGSPAYYTLRPGILDRSGDPNPNSLAVLWIRHPGATPLATSMLSRPPVLQAGSLLSAIENGIIPGPFPQRCDVVAGPNITATATKHSSGPQNLGLLLFNSAISGVQTYQFRIPLPPFIRPRAIEVFADIPSLGAIGFSTAPYQLYDTTGAVLSMTPSALNGPITALGSTPAGSFAIGNYTADVNPPVSLGVTVSVPALTAGVFIKALNLIGD
jgi:hypothetical protein